MNLELLRKTTHRMIEREARKVWGIVPYPFLDELALVFRARWELVPVRFGVRFPGISGILKKRGLAPAPWWAVPFLVLFFLPYDSDDVLFTFWKEDGKIVYLEGCWGSFNDPVRGLSYYVVLESNRTCSGEIRKVLCPGGNKVICFPAEGVEGE